MNNEDLLTELRWALDNIGASRDYFRIGNALESAIKALTPSATEETAIGHARYEYLRTLNPREFAALWDRAALADERFDDLVDCYRMKREPAPTGCGAIFKESEGWSCDCERDHPAPCAKGERSDDAGGRQK